MSRWFTVAERQPESTRRIGLEETKEEGERERERERERADGN